MNSWDPSARADGANDALPRLLDAEAFSLIVNHQVEVATRLRYSLAVLYVSPDLPPPQAPAMMSLAELAQHTLAVLRTTDVATGVTPLGLAILLVDAQPSNLPAILERIAASFAAWSRRLSGLTFSAGGSGFPSTATGAVEALQQAADLLARARAAGGNCLYLPD